jgi:REP element-mobilizing transposase RayT
MTAARQTQVCLRDTPYYHCIARCVRRAWLWGVDDYAGKDYSHRKAWVIDRLRQLSRIFAVEVCAYAVMSNHYHVVLYVDVNRALAWNDQAVIRRWRQLFRLPALVERYRQGEPMSLAERDAVRDVLKIWRQRLMDVSGFMRCLNESLARRANQEDGCTGRFWEGRFKSQALLDEAGLLTAMAYVDLNPIRRRPPPAWRTPNSPRSTSGFKPSRDVRPTGCGCVALVQLPLHPYPVPGITICNWCSGRAGRFETAPQATYQRPFPLYCIGSISMQVLGRQ